MLLKQKVHSSFLASFQNCYCGTNSQITSHNCSPLGDKVLTQCVTEAGSKSALGRLNSLHRQTSCNYNNFIFTVKTSGIPREMEHLPVCYAVSHWCWSWSPTAHLPIQNGLLRTVKPQGKTGSPGKKAVHSHGELLGGAALPVQPRAPSAPESGGRLPATPTRPRTRALSVASVHRVV
uniref:Uncharacterized protein n=1 Tax=Pipistrellus kuhlii TaxID=59472 RepID=A0A7J7XVV7_PIPKU|nr:hypothetical protein mPipKuh1_010467 [Pipistrellus kuhlii]